MRTLPFVSWIANAAARFAGTYGSVTATAQQTGCSRQCAYDHAHKVLAAVQAEHGGGPTREDLILQNDALHRENTQLWDWLSQTIELPPEKQQQFAVTAAAMGLSLNQIGALLAILLGTAGRPGRSTIHRWVQAAAKAAGRVLSRLDRAARALVLVGCLDEIFFRRRPVLVGVEPHSMVWFLGTKADDRRGSTWSAALRPWTALQYVVSDAGSGLLAGIAQIQQDRRQGQQVPLDNGLDVFHTKMEVQRVLKVLWSGVEGLWEQAEVADGGVAAAQRQGRDARGAARHAGATWKKVAGAFGRYEQAEAAWKRAELALDWFRPDGQLNDRSWARDQIAAALPGLSGAVWSKVRGFLQAEAALTSLDRVHGQLAQLGLSEDLRAALVRLWWSRRQQPRGTNQRARGGYRGVAPLLQELLCRALDPDWWASYRQVAAVLRRTARASSAVECMNSVLRMDQSRHRTLNQELLDLKRLYWNTRAFRGGKRKARCPYEHLGLALPSYDFWGLLQEEMITAGGRGEETAPGIAA
jgi:hypothetical protein